MKKFLLVAINSKYIHSNLAVYCLKKAAGCYENNVEIVEYSINNQMEEILKGIYLKKPDYIGFSCYIWNIGMVTELITELNKILPEVPIWLGGPEVSYNPLDYVNNYTIAGVMKGEGERIFSELISCYLENHIKDIPSIKGLTMKHDDIIIDNENPDLVKLNTPMPYNVTDLENKIIYYESSRGCPFSCSYCLSSVDKKLRFRDMEVVKADLQTFIDKEVRLVKFIDRTFNAKKEHAYEILRFIKEKDRGITSFHFEIAADLLDEEGLSLLNSLRPGLIQLEIGVQSTNADTIKAIYRNMNLAKVKENVARIKEGRNIHVHLDLIAGLPFEDLNSFKKSFNEIYEMKPEQLQLGFLKLLNGSLMKQEATKYGIVSYDKPPYEVLRTDFLSYEDILLLKTVENMVEMFYNSGMFNTSIKFLEERYKSPFDLYYSLGKFFEERYLMGSLPSRNDKYRLLYDFSKDFCNEEELKCFSELLKYDMLLRDNLKSPPDFIHMDNGRNIEASRMFDDKKLTKAEHVEVFNVNVAHYINTGNILVEEFPMYFNYLNRDVLTGNALVKIIEMENVYEKSSGIN